MAATSSVWVTSSTKLAHNFEQTTGGVRLSSSSFGLLPSRINNDDNNKSCSPPSITCRFTRNSPYRSRRGGMASSLEAATAVSAGTVAPTSVPVRVAYELLQAGHRYLDVRTPEEFSEGHVPGAVNIPYMFKLASGMARNIHFTAQVSSHFDKDDEILIGCQIGKRSMMAANDLVSAGYTGIVDVAGGYGAWVQSQLPVQV